MTDVAGIAADADRRCRVGPARRLVDATRADHHLHALTAIVASLAVGALGGWLMRSRWAMLLTPVLFAAVFELTRATTAGPLVDGIRLGGGGSFGILAFVLGRGLHAVLALLPMILGAALGAGLARRRNEGRPRTHGWARAGLVTRRVIAAVAAVALLALTAGISRPASTDPILTDTGTPMAGSVAELIRVPIGGHDQAMMIRGTSTENPVLLFLAGGPGGTELGAMRRHGQALEKDFVVVTWDQRGTGKSYDSLDPTSTLTLQQAVSDTIEVSNYLRNRFGQDKIYLLGQSYGTILGVLAAQQHPELYRAYIGVGQMVDPRETDGVFYTDALAWARRSGDTALVDKLTSQRPAAVHRHARLRAVADQQPRSIPTTTPTTPRAPAASPRTCPWRSTPCWSRPTPSPGSSTSSPSCTHSCRASTSARTPPSSPSRST